MLSIIKSNPRVAGAIVFAVLSGVGYYFRVDLSALLALVGGAL